MIYYLFSMNLLNFPNSINAIIQALQEEENYWEQQTVGEWMQLLSTRNNWDDEAMKLHLDISADELAKYKISKELPQKDIIIFYKTLL